MIFEIKLKLEFLHRCISAGGITLKGKQMVSQMCFSHES